ncbi:LuxR C-terminal-related transcriptional regulator [Pseudonocardia broussonetiae]|uniref:LuxR family transcriptional regulator n=1 Tax=Pseudonocardia broussonetiae TaxID=2736640 RepID=A0A6M6JL21_9PSEU|nr:LuxR C-terminal-related transcriptional regulator [Pseudonocardia broussonetiae]QJY47975.1 LuxR family transcriptional regulator [Pseudonocardia broussonetiae]
MVLVPQAKIAVPRLPPGFVERAALRADLDPAAPADVVLVCAPAGYGKTLLLADWARSSTLTDTAWVTVDRDDNDPGRLWAAVVAALATCPSVPSAGEPHIGADQRRAPDPDQLAESLLALPRPVHLVLDDVHELVEPQVLRALARFLTIMPSTVRLVLASRLDPPLSLPRLRLAGRLRELRAAQMAFTPDQAGALLAGAGLELSRPQVDVLHRRTGGWPAGLRLAALGLAESADREAFLTQFSGDDRSVADYLIGEILSDLPADVQEFLRVISISDPVPVGLAAELTGRDAAGGVLDALERQTSLVTATGPGRDAYQVQELLRTHLLAELRRLGVRRTADLHGAAARWWAAQDQPVDALEHATRSGDTPLVAELLHRFAVRLVLAGDHGPLRRAMTTIGAPATTSDPTLALASALTHLEAGELSAAQSDLRRGRRSSPADGGADLAVLRAVADQLAAVPSGPVPATVAELEVLSAEPELEALARLTRGSSQLGHHDLVGAGTELRAALALSRRHAFDYLAMQCLALLGVVAGTTGDMRAMRTASGQALDIAADHGWESTQWSGAASAMTSYTALLRADPTVAEHRSAEALLGGTVAWSPALRYVLRAVHGAAVFDLGDRAAGLAELQQARSEFGDHDGSEEQCAAAAMLEFRAAQLLGHSVATRTVLTWLAEHLGDVGEAAVMRAWTDAAAGRHEHARALLRPVLDGPVATVLPHTVVDAWLIETSIALTAGERPAARRALLSALTAAELIDAVRPFAHAGPGVREMLVHQRGSFGASDAFVDRALAAGAGRGHEEALLSERELTVLELLPSLLSLDEIAADIIVSVNTVKSHVRSIYSKLGVSSRRLAVLTARERGLLGSSVH